MQNRNWARTIVRVALVLNLLAVAAFAVLAYAMPHVTDLSVRSNYVALDRAGVINQDALGKFHPSYGFTPENERNSVPRFIVGPALSAQRENAYFGLLLAGMNVVMVGGLLVSGRRSAAAKDPAQG